MALLGAMTLLLSAALGEQVSVVDFLKYDVTAEALYEGTVITDDRSPTLRWMRMVGTHVLLATNSTVTART